MNLRQSPWLSNHFQSVKFSPVQVGMYHVTTNSKPIRGEENRRKESLFSWPRLQYDHRQVLTGHYVPSVTVAYVQVLAIPWDKCGVILRTHVWVSDWSWMRFSLFLALFSLSQSLPHSDPHPPSSSFLTTQSFMCLSPGVLNLESSPILLSQGFMSRVIGKPLRQCCQVSEA